MYRYSKTGRLWYNLKSDLRWWREVLFGSPWAEIKGNENKKKPCLFIRFLDCISRDAQEVGDNMDKIMDEDVKASAKFNEETLGLPPEANNAKRFI